VDREDGEAVDWAAMATTLSAIGNLKRTPRTGWLDRGVPPADTESVADHAFRVALLAWVVAMTPGSAEAGTVDPARVLLVALAHDLPEALAGDPTPYAQSDIPDDSDPVARRAFLDRRQERDPARTAAKRDAEARAMAALVARLPAPVAEGLREAWREYEDQVTPEARLVRQADRLETYLQSREYLADDPALPMRSFALQVEDPATLPDARMRALRDAITELSETGDGRDDPSSG
jgi:putative hydrolase of HD superfamily